MKVAVTVHKEEATGALDLKCAGHDADEDAAVSADDERPAPDRQDLADRICDMPRHRLPARPVQDTGARIEHAIRGRNREISAITNGT